MSQLHTKFALDLEEMIQRETKDKLEAKVKTILFGNDFMSVSQPGRDPGTLEIPRHPFKDLHVLKLQGKICICCNRFCIYRQSSVKKL